MNDDAPELGIDLLPKESLVPFHAYRLANATVVWRGRSDAPLPEKYHAAPIDGEDAGDFYHPASAEFFADRYGGQGISTNGGSGRCGWRDGVQIKGIGRTPLSALDAPRGHSYGGLLLRDAMREAVWSAVLEQILPHGAVSVHAIVDTGTVILDHGTSRKHRRGLIVRPAPFRPAHFMRAVYFRPSGDGQMASEERRMLSMMRAFPAVLLAIYGDAAVSNTGGRTDITGAVLSMLSRYADQLAALFHLRIVHGGLSPSNVCIDGRLLDFGMTTSVSDYGPIITSGRFGTMLEQAELLFDSLVPLFFYAEKFNSRLILPPTEDLRGYFLKKFQQAKCVRMLRLFSWTEAEIAAIPTSLTNNLNTALDAVIRQKCREPFKLHSHCEYFVSEMPRHFGDCSLDQIVTQLETGQSISERLTGLQELGMENSAASDLLSKFEAAACFIMRKRTESPHASGRPFRAKPIRPLYYKNLNDRIDRALVDVDRDTKAIQLILDDLIRESVMCATAQ